MKEYKAIVNGKEVVAGAYVERSRYTDEERLAINELRFQDNLPLSYRKLEKFRESIVSVYGDLIDLDERYEALLDLLPQDMYSKAGAHPQWVAEAVYENVYIKEAVKGDVKDMIETHSSSIDDLKEALGEYFDIEE